MSKITLNSNVSGTGTFTIASPNSNTDRTLTLPDVTGIVALNGTTITSGTAVASTSGTSIDFTGIPSWVKRITVMFSGVSATGANNWLINVGSGSIVSSGYSSGVIAARGSATSSTALSSSTGFLINVDTAGSYNFMGLITLANITGNTWVESGLLTNSGGDRGVMSGGNITLSGALDRLRISTSSTDTFDAGSINILLEG